MNKVLTNFINHSQKLATIDERKRVAMPGTSLRSLDKPSFTAQRFPFYQFSVIELPQFNCYLNNVAVLIANFGEWHDGTKILEPSNGKRSSLSTPA